MAKRNMIKTADDGRNLVRSNLRYDLSADEVCELMHMATDAPFKDYDNVYKAICISFYYGFALGGRSVANGSKSV